MVQLKQSSHTFQLAPLVCVWLAALAPPAAATWGVVLTDTRTGEVAIGEATCIPQVDLPDLTTVIVTGVGGATVQGWPAQMDIPRRIIRDEFLRGTPPANILPLLLQNDPMLNYHQFLIAATTGEAVTYTGSVVTFEAQWAGGRVGRTGDISYVVAGDVLTGAPVVDEAVRAVIETDGDLAAKLMAAMQAARSMGGDGRCSCLTGPPTSCGSPPPSFQLSAMSAYIAIARAGDTPHCLACSSADHFLKINLHADPWPSVDPITIIQGDLDAWRTSMVGRPDAVRSTAMLDPPVLPANGAATSEMTITLRDWQRLPITAPIQSVTVVHGATSDSLSSIGPVIDQGNGIYTVTLTAGTSPGVDRFRITVDDGIRPVILMPEPSLSLFDPAATPGGNLPVLATRVYPSMPNPLRSTTIFSFELASPARAVLRVVDLAGRPVATVLEADLPPGRREVRWDGTDTSGRPVASGVYFYELQAGGEVVTRKFAVVR